jgi:hypothetical protein
MEAILREQVVQVVSRHASGNLWVTGPDQLGISVAKVPEPRIHVSPSAAPGHYLLNLRLRCGSYSKTSPVISENLQFLDIFIRLARCDRMNAAGVVPNHAAERAPAMGGGVGPECQVMDVGSLTKGVEHHPGFNVGPTLLRLDLEDPPKVL